MKYLCGMRGIKPTPPEIVFYSYPCHRRAHSRNPPRSPDSTIPRSIQVACRSLPVSLSLAQLHNRIHNVAIRQGSKTAPLLSPDHPLPSAADPPDVPYNETPETSLRIRPSGGARYLSPDAFLSFGGVAFPSDVASRRGRRCPACFFFYFCSSLSLLPCPYSTRDLPSR